MFDMDIGGMPTSICESGQLLPLKENNIEERFSIMTRIKATMIKKVLPFIFGREGVAVDAVPLPSNKAVTSAFDAVFAAIREFRASIPPYMSQSSEEAIEAIERGETPLCCLPIEVTAVHRRLMGEVQAAYEKFLAVLEEQER